MDKSVYKKYSKHNKSLGQYKMNTSSVWAYVQYLASYDNLSNNIDENLSIPNTEKSFHVDTWEILIYWL